MTPELATHPAVLVERDDHGIVHVVFDDPGEKVNLLRSDVLVFLDRLLDDVRGRGDVHAVILRSAKPGMFIAGADVDEIASYTDHLEAAEGARYGQRVFEKLAALGVPTACAINGPCMGGGTEMALACTFRVAADAPAVRIGLPETRIGIIPGFGGTQRLPRRVGLRHAVDMILTGRALDARAAKRIGLVDRVVPAEYLVSETVALLARAVEDLAATERAHAVRPPWSIRLVEKIEPLRRFYLTQARKKTELKVRPQDYPAPFRALEAIAAAYRMPIPQGLDVEARIIGELIPSRTAKNLIWLFKNQTAIKGDDAAVRALPRRVDRTAVLGAGVMGGGIARLLADRDLPVRLRDIRYDAILTALRTAKSVWDRRVRRRSMTARELERRMRFIAPTLDPTGLSTTDLIIEAVVEDLEVKRSVLAEVEAVLARRGPRGARTVFASNTSSLPIGRIAEGSTHPERVVGLHFFNPVDRMPLVEVIAGPRSSPEAVATVRKLAIRVGKVPVVVRDSPGFLVNRILMLYLAEAARLFREGVRIEAVDGALQRFGMPMGPFALLDQVGLDTAGHVAAVLREAFGDRVEGSEDLLRALVSTDRLGQKNGRGFYRYRGSQRTVPDREVYRLGGVETTRELPAETIQERLVLAMINEAARCLEEDVVREPRDVDLAMVLGTGFPPFRGGLLRYADELGIPVVADRLNRLADAHGERFRAATLLRTMVRAERQFYEDGGRVHRIP